MQASTVQQLASVVELALQVSELLGVEVNSLGEFIYTKIMNKNVNQTQTPGNYEENPRREIPRSKEKERSHWIRDITRGSQCSITESIL